MYKFKKNIIEILEDIKRKKIDKGLILKNIDKIDIEQTDGGGINFLMHIIHNNKEFRFTKNEILFLLKNFNLRGFRKNIDFLLNHIIYNNIEQELNFNKYDILDILNMNMFDLKQQDEYGANILICILFHNKRQKLNFNKYDIINILDKFNLEQKAYLGISFYDLIKEGESVEDFSPDEMSNLLSKINIETKNVFGNNILIDELKNGLIINNKTLIRKILETDNKKIISNIIIYIKQINWSQEELLLFIYKNKIEDNSNIFNLL